MCGVFYIDDETAREIEKMIRKVDERLNGTRVTGDIRPTNIASVIAARNNELVLSPQRWGFPGFAKQNVIINARAESVLEKRMFRDSVLKRRIVIPATGFYEWNSQKEKATFTPMPEKNQNSILFMAGFYNHFENEDKFVILTTAANDSMKDTHDRMPLLLESYELESWLCDDNRLHAFLGKVPPQLQKNQEYEQQRLTLY